jgi:hypothetical protein
MKALFLALTLTLLLSACGDQSSGPQSSGATKGLDMDEPIEFGDPIVGKLLRATVGRLAGDITTRDLSAVKQLSLYDSFGDIGVGLAYSYDSYSSDGNRPLFGNYANVNVSQEESQLILSYEDIKYLTGLEALALSVEPANYSFLSYMPELRFLDISLSGGLPGFAAVADCEKLEYLSISLQNNASEFDVSVLQGLAELKSVSISGVLTGFFEPCDNLKVLTINCFEFDLSVLQGLTGLRSLTLNNSGSGNLRGFSELSDSIKELSISIGDRSELDLSVLQELAGLRSLTLSSNGNLRGFSGLSDNIEEVTISGSDFHGDRAGLDMLEARGVEVHRLYRNQ